MNRLDVGDPDLTPPDVACDFLRDAVDAPQSHRYPGDRVSRDLRKAIASYYARRFGVDLDPES